MEFYDLKLFLPELLLIFSSIIILIYGIFFNKKKESLKNVFYITLFFLFFSLYASLKIIDFDKAYFNNLLINNNFTIFFKTLILSGTIVIALISFNQLKDLKILTSEFFFLINFFKEFHFLSIIFISSLKYNSALSHKSLIFSLWLFMEIFDT